MKKVSIVLMIIISGIFFVSCESNTTQELSPIVTNPTYSQNIEPVISAKCVSCHSGGSQYPDLDSYAAVKDAGENGVMLCRIDGSCGNIMPQSGAMPQQTIDMIKLWAQQGYAN